MPLSTQEIDQRLAGSDWSREADAIVRECKLADFAAAIAFVNQVAELAERANHHPDILVHGWNQRAPDALHPLRGRAHRRRLRARRRDRQSRLSRSDQRPC